MDLSSSSVQPQCVPLALTTNAAKAKRGDPPRSTTLKTIFLLSPDCHSVIKITVTVLLVVAPPDACEPKSSVGSKSAQPTDVFLCHEEASSISTTLSWHCLCSPPDATVLCTVCAPLTLKHHTRCNLQLAAELRLHPLHDMHVDHLQMSCCTDHADYSLFSSSWKNSHRNLCLLHAGATTQDSCFKKSLAPHKLISR